MTHTQAAEKALNELKALHKNNKESFKIGFIKALEQTEENNKKRDEFFKRITGSYELWLTDKIRDDHFTADVHKALSILNKQPVKVPQFSHMKFKDEATMKKWIRKTSHCIVYLKGFGQDMETLYIHNTGEIIHTDFSQSVYIGRFVNMRNLNCDRPLEIWDDEMETFYPYKKLIPEEIIY